MDDIKDRWLSVEGICKYLFVSRDTVYKWIDIGGMSAHSLGRLWKFKKGQVNVWVEAGGATDCKNKVSGE